jgi:hypothetical protein
VHLNETWQTTVMVLLEWLFSDRNAYTSTIIRQHDRKDIVAVIDIAPACPFMLFRMLLI